jgi:hypothetical protein
MNADARTDYATATRRYDPQFAEARTAIITAIAGASICSDAASAAIRTSEASTRLYRAGASDRRLDIARLATSLRKGVDKIAPGAPALTRAAANPTFKFQAALFPQRQRRGKRMSRDEWNELVRRARAVDMVDSSASRRRSSGKRVRRSLLGLRLRQRSLRSDQAAIIQLPDMQLRGQGVIDCCDVSRRRRLCRGGQTVDRHDIVERAALAGS